MKDNRGKEIIAAGKVHQETAIELESMNYLVEGVIGATS
jgi:basic membrane protein A